MTWVPRPETANLEPIEGVGPWREIADEEFAAIEAEYDARFSPEQAGSLRTRFDHADELKTKKKAPATPAAEGN